LREDLVERVGLVGCQIDCQHTVGMIRCQVRNGRITNGWRITLHQIKREATFPANGSTQDTQCLFIVIGCGEGWQF